MKRISAEDLLVLSLIANKPRKPPQEAKRNKRPVLEDSAMIVFKNNTESHGYRRLKVSKVLITYNDYRS